MNFIRFFVRQSRHLTTLGGVCASIFLCGIPVVVYADFLVTYPVRIHAQYAGIDLYDGNPVDELVEPPAIIVHASDIQNATTTWTITLTAPWMQDVPLSRGVYALVRTDEGYDEEGWPTWWVERGSATVQFANYDFVHASFSSTTPTTDTLHFLLPQLGSSSTPSGTYRLIAAELPTTKYIYNPDTDTVDESAYTDADFVTYLMNPFSADMDAYRPVVTREIAFTYVADSASSSPPTITLVGDALVSLEQGVIFADPGATAYDAEDGDISSSVVVSGSVDSTIVGTTTLTYTVTDSSGLTASVIRTVVVVPAAVTTPTAYWAEIQSGEGALTLRATASLTATGLKQLPDGWAIWVASTTDSEGNDVEADGYLWYHVEDATDGTKGWMAAGPVDTNHHITKEYLANEATRQTELEDKATKTYDTKEERAALIVEAVNHYYNNASTTENLYSSGDRSHIVDLKSLPNFVADGQTYPMGSFPEDVILGFLAYEDGPSFNNEIVTWDYGHGIGQITIQEGAYDNRGHFSDVRVFPCALDGGKFKDCYTPDDQTNLRSRLHYSENPVDGHLYKFYTNTKQSIYSNLKDSLGKLNMGLNPYVRTKPYRGNTQWVVGTTTISLADMRKIVAVKAYNGLGSCSDPLRDLNGVHNYLGNVASRVESLADYYPNKVATQDALDLAHKMRVSEKNHTHISICSPGTLKVINAAGDEFGLSDISVNEEGLPNVVYDERAGKFAEVYFADNDYQYQVIGTEAGTYSFYIDNTTPTGTSTIELHNVPLSLGEIYTYQIDWNAVAQGKPGVIQRIDIDGDGTNEEEHLLYADGAPADTTPPEALISFSTTTNSITTTGIDETSSTTIATTSTNTVIADADGNTLMLSIARALELPRLSTLVMPSFTYSSGTTTSATTSVRYFHVTNPKTGKYSLFISHIKTPTDRFLSVYVALLNKTYVLESKPQDDAADLSLQQVALLLRKKVKTLNGLVVPHIRTSGGQVFINY